MHDRVRSRTAFELILFGLVPLFLTLATVWILWHSLEKINPDEVTRHSGIRNHRVVGLVSNIAAAAATEVRATAKKSQATGSISGSRSGSCAAVTIQPLTGVRWL